LKELDVSLNILYSTGCSEGEHSCTSEVPFGTVIGLSSRLMILATSSRSYLTSMVPTPFRRVSARCGFFPFAGFEMLLLLLSVYGEKWP
ncbi:MAG: hypothetical protein P1U53_15235, partial [Sulfitobacter sp.]|nr:hypothetical protein [Sulfitobacter sp.]